MIYASKTISSATQSAAIPTNYMNTGNAPISVGVSGTFVGTYDIEVTLDNTMDGSTLTWQKFATGKTAAFLTVISQPVRGVRINCTAYTSGSMTLTVLQGASH